MPAFLEFYSKQKEGFFIRHNEMVANGKLHSLQKIIFSSFEVLRGFRFCIIFFDAFSKSYVQRIFRLSRNSLACLC